MAQNKSVEYTPVTLWKNFLACWDGRKQARRGGTFLWGSRASGPTDHKLLSWNGSARAQVLANVSLQVTAQPLGTDSFLGLDQMVQNCPLCATWTQVPTTSISEVSLIPLSMTIFKYFKTVTFLPIVLSNTCPSWAAPGVNVSEALQLLERDMGLKEPRVSMTPRLGWHALRQLPYRRWGQVEGRWCQSPCDWGGACLLHGTVSPWLCPHVAMTWPFYPGPHTENLGLFIPAVILINRPRACVYYMLYIILHIILYIRHLSHIHRFA